MRLTKNRLLWIGLSVAALGGLGTWLFFKGMEPEWAFDDLVDLKKAVHVEDRAGVIYAVHRVERRVSPTRGSSH